ncbi:MAG: DMT family transporter [Pelagibacteraceae bacterium]|jgi:drug/metabolite transporter (DMT)-like permease|nr:DMT family transporter [Pelagibacteraceae bacterium]
MKHNFENNNTFGLILGLSGYTIFVLLDSIIKLNLVNKYPVLEINFLICLFAFIPVLAALAIVGNWNTLINNKIHIQLLRGVLGLICGALIVNSFKQHALIEIYPILFSTPLILTILSHFILKEKVGIRRWSAVLIGFAGVLIVSRPGTIHFTLPLFGLFFAAIILALNVLIIRRLANTQSSIAFAFYGTVGGLVISGIFSFQNFVSVPLEDVIIFIVCGIIGGIGGLCITGASKILESSEFAPIQYVQLVAGFIMGYLFFRDLPDTFEIIGSLVIVFSGLFIIYRENKLNIRPFVSSTSRIRDMFFRGH